MGWKIGEIVRLRCVVCIRVAHLQALSTHPLIDILQPLIVKVAEEAHQEERDTGVEQVDVLLVFLAEDLHAHHHKGKNKEQQNNYEDGEVRDGAGNGGSQDEQIALQAEEFEQFEQREEGGDRVDREGEVVRFRHGRQLDVVFREGIEIAHNGVEEELQPKGQREERDDDDDPIGDVPRIAYVALYGTRLLARVVKLVSFDENVIEEVEVETCLGDVLGQVVFIDEHVHLDSRHLVAWHHHPSGRQLKEEFAEGVQVEVCIVHQD